MSVEAQSVNLPGWAQKLREQYLAGVASQFLLHSNVNDLLPYQGEYVSLRQFLSLLLGKKELLIFYNRSEGVTFAQPEMRETFNRALSVALGPLNPHQSGLPHDPAKVFPLLETIFSIHSSGIVIDYAETIVPAGEVSYMSGDDRSNLVTLRRWASSPQLLRADSVVILVTENVTDIHPSLRNSASRMDIIEVPFPDDSERLDFIRWMTRKTAGAVELEMSPEALSAVTAGLTRVHIADIFRQAARGKADDSPAANGSARGNVVTFELVRERKKLIIEKECSNLVEFLEPSRGFDVIGGLDPVKEILSKTARAVKAGKTRWVPMGILFNGPPGTGKTVLAEAFARECGLNCLKLKNFREKWVGSTESNLEKILNVIKALAPVVVIVDEIDQAIGSRGEEGDSGTSNRIFAMLISFMGDTSHRGKIIFIGMCNRPDLVDEAFKRPGRFDLKIPFFYPENPAEAAAVLRALARKNGVAAQAETLRKCAERLAGYSGAELESILLQAARYADDDGREVPEQQDLDRAAEEFVVRRDPMVRYMELVSVKECSSRNLLPERYKNLQPEELERRLQLLHAEAGGG